uniref:von Willebrand factor A domain containing 3A n=1 Tax=Pygocentrus nattereri TaxID=42514 RepID=A0A3B4CMY9_PYGNA
MTVSVVSEISKDLDSLSLSDLKSETYDTSVALCIQPPAPLPTTSAEWLKTHSLKAKKLGLYQLLAPNVYSPLEGFVPILGKTVHSTVHEKAMVQFEWHDGTVKNVHVDPSLLQNYQKQLLEAERVLEDRVVWLSNTGSRQIWGIVCEQRVQVLLDMSEMNSHYQLHIQHAVRLLLQEQLPSTHSFNVTVFGSDVKPWREQMVPPTHENLQDVLQWIQGLECGGGRNTLAAIRRAVEDESNSDSSLTRGVYILTTGMPDQDPVRTTFAYVSECCSGSGVRLHVCLFAGENEPLRCLAPRYVTWAETAHVLRGLAHAGNGRFHWITDTGIVESDDIIVLIGEMEKAANYWQKVRLDSHFRNMQQGSVYCTLVVLLAGPYYNSFFCTPGAVFKTYLKPKSMQKTISTFKLPKHEDICSTKQWLKQFGIRSLKLDLHKLVSGPECTHRKKLVRTVLKSVSAKYCTIFPSVQLNGCVRHLLLSPGELKQYLLQTERVLQRYAQRMQWLLSGSRRMFGCVLEQAVCVLLDMSGSMAPCLPKLQKELASLIWEQLHTNSAELVEASEERCKEAVQWLGQLSTHGSTSTLHALQAGCAFEDSLGVYLITDGRFDCSCSLVLKEAERLTAGKNIVVHTIALNCQDRWATKYFVLCLAHKTRGRFHEVPSHTDTAAAKELLSSNFSEVEVS